MRTILHEYFLHLTLHHADYILVLDHSCTLPLRGWKQYMHNHRKWPNKTHVPKEQNFIYK